MYVLGFFLFNVIISNVYAGFKLLENSYTEQSQESESEKPVKCQDLETGTFYKVGAEWYSKDPKACEMLSCRPGYYPQIKVTNCNEYFNQVHDTAIKCRMNSRRRPFPSCCSQCKKELHLF